MDQPAFPQLLRRRSLLAWPLLSAGLPARAQTAATRTHTFGVVPQQSASELARLWIPILQWVAGRAGVPLRFATAADIPTFERRLLAGEYDFAYMNPYHYTVFSMRPGYRALAREKDRRLRGLVVVRKDSPLQALAQLAGQEVAFPAPAAFAATVLVRAELARQAVGIQPRFVGSHESVYLNVARGLHPAGGGIERTLAAMDASVRDQLRVLWRTQAYTPHAFAAHPRVAPAVVDAVGGAMQAMGADPVGRAALQAVQFNGIEAAADADWADVRSLGVKTLADLLRD